MRLLSTIINTTTDRLLERFLRKGTAVACVPEHGQRFRRLCYCASDGFAWLKTCTIGCTGTVTCGGCYRTQNGCP